MWLFGVVIFEWFSPTSGFSSASHEALEGSRDGVFSVRVCLNSLFGDWGQKECHPWGPQVAVGSIFPFTNRLFVVIRHFEMICAATHN